MLKADSDRIKKTMRENPDNWHEILDSTDIKWVIDAFPGPFTDEVSVADLATGIVKKKMIRSYQATPQQVYEKVTAMDKYKKEIMNFKRKLKNLVK